MRVAKAIKYSVLLRYPDYISPEGEVYFAWVKARSPEQAIERAREKVAWHNRMDAPKDFAVLLVLKGHQENVSPE